jgi:hypothetical protein
MPGYEAVSTLHWPKNDILSFLQKKVSRLDKINFLHLLNKCRGFATYCFQIATPKVIQKCTEAFLSRLETFFCRNLKNDRMSFLGQRNVETASHPGI